MVGQPSEEEAHLEGARSGSAEAYKATLADRDLQLAEVYKTKGPGSERWKRIERKLTIANEKSRSIFASLQRLSDGKRIAGWILAFVFVALAAMEAPINKFMMDNILRGNNFDSYVLSFFLTIIILVLAHIAGTQTRQIYGQYQEKFYVSNILSSLVLLGLLAVVVGALTIGRAYYSTAGAALPGRDIFSEITAKVQNVGPWAAFVAALSDKAAFFLACLNGAGIAGAFFLSFISHDSDKDYQSALDSEYSAEKKLARLAVRYDRAIRRVGRKFLTRLTNLAAAHGAQNAEVISLKRRRNAPITDEDRVDLTKLDRFLEQARAEIADKSQKFSSASVAADNPTVSAEGAGSVEAPGSVAQLVAKERR